MISRSQLFFYIKSWCRYQTSWPPLPYSITMIHNFGKTLIWHLLNLTENKWISCKIINYFTIQILKKLIFLTYYFKLIETINTTSFILYLVFIYEKLYYRLNQNVPHSNKKVDRDHILQRNKPQWIIISADNNSFLPHAFLGVDTSKYLETRLHISYIMRRWEVMKASRL